MSAFWVVLEEYVYYIWGALVGLYITLAIFLLVFGGLKWDRWSIFKE
jgi:hypothetical protein